MDFTSIYAILHMDPAVASAVLEGLPKRVEKALDKRVGKTEKYREVLAKVLANLWHQNAFATWDKAKAETALTVLCPLLLCNQVLPKINYKTVADMAEDILAKAEEKETKEKKNGRRTNPRAVRINRVGNRERGAALEAHATETGTGESAVAATARKGSKTDVGGARNDQVRKELSMVAKRRGPSDITRRRTMMRERPGRRRHRA